MCGWAAFLKICNIVRLIAMQCVTGVMCAYKLGVVVRQSVSVEQPIPALADQAGLVSVLAKVAKGQSRKLQLALVAGVQAFFRTSGCRKGCAALACSRPLAGGWVHSRLVLWVTDMHNR